MDTFSIKGQIVDLVKRKIFTGEVFISHGKIAEIKPIEGALQGPFILPGFIDAHIHIESSMLVPSEFARMASIHGTVATVSDPHEIANVLGLDGIRFMLENGEKVPFHFYFGASSCVPATPFETAGASLNANTIELLFKDYHLHYLSEMMNFPGVLHHDPQVMEKIAIANKFQVPVDGHAPGLRGEEAAAYIKAGISTDHECFTLEEALEKIHYGMKILIREGSAAKNYEALHSLLETHPENVMFCSDDKHPHELAEGHINQLVKRSVIDKGYDVMNVLRVACLHPVEHYNLDCGLLRHGDSADFIVIDNFQNFNVLSTYIKGFLVAQNGKTNIKSIPVPLINHFNCSPKKPENFQIKAERGKLQVIQVIEGQLMTNKILMGSRVKEGLFITDIEKDLLKIAVVNRYHEQPIALGFINRFGLKEGAIASCIAHDSHNIICVGVTDEDMCAAVNAIIAHQGGISVASNGKIEILSLPVGGIMSDKEGFQVAKEYVFMDRLAKQLGTPLSAPFMTLSFMALLVIPSLKLSDKGLFDGSTFAFTPLVLP
ncbi:MAG: adenine deaminase [Candidatus Protochlamydia sp.]|nr:adenine deaminase [Candidatus Protochlamydia sp.]